MTEILSGYTELAAKALDQIQERNYKRELEERGVAEIISYGVAFSGKSVEVRSRIL